MSDIKDSGETQAEVSQSRMRRNQLYLDPEPCLGNCSWIHDPSIYVQNGTYYRFSTSGNIAIVTAESLNGPWTYRGSLLEERTRIKVDEARQDIWAPNVFKIGDTFYCHYSVSYLGSQVSQIGFATSKTLDPGTWTDHGSPDIPHSPKYNLIDPGVFQDTPGSPGYLTFGSYWSGIFSLQFPSSALVHRSDTLHSSPDIVTNQAHNKTTTASIPLTYSTGSLRNLIRNTSVDPDVVEGAFMYKHAGQYYLFFSAGACCATPPLLAPPGREYRILVCRSARSDGRFVDVSHGDVYAPGGQGVLFDEQTQRTVLYYHYIKPSVGYAADRFFFGLNYLEWVGG
ncbi:Arabinanase/levansucrase/invertase [Bimuria novae-zelandiae CBS 107.79]|uniref:Arabinan endo-1,5-alpha-L-arabinosidase n=1 Tax=Bimuria novae-zelandiae CBS 107.79 TaxID=1447943 RepID=A0A6A5VJ61_9PLEO|nr:Arabinanase/levansucrase/invertase [Bimuria novae-zelandiae CBS 107.79]